MNDVRADGLARWARSVDPLIAADACLISASDDASFRRYFRFDKTAVGKVFVDAPPEHEDNQSFVRVSAALAGAGLNCSKVLAVDYELGYMAVSDLGNDVYLGVMTAEPKLVPELYADAVQALGTMIEVECDLPLYDEAKLREEMSLFPDWFLDQQLELKISASERGMLEQVYQLLTDSALEQPRHFVHRDYHCRNLMRTPENNPGILDFQDALIGPVTYDLVSLYKDCYYRFPRAEVERVIMQFQEMLESKEIVSADAPLLRWFDFMGAQRHLKCAGIFSRLNIRDGKPRYLGDIPLVVDYLVEVGGLYPELSEFGDWLKNRVVPLLSEAPFVRTADVKADVPFDRSGGRGS